MDATTTKPEAWACAAFYPIFLSDDRTGDPERWVRDAICVTADAIRDGECSTFFSPLGGELARFPLDRDLPNRDADGHVLRRDWRPPTPDEAAGAIRAATAWLVGLGCDEGAAAKLVGRAVLSSSRPGACEYETIDVR